MKITEREGFSLAIRIAGLVVALYGVDWLLRFILGQTGYFTVQRTDMTYYLLSDVAYIAACTYLLRGGIHFVRFAYGDEIVKLSYAEDVYQIDEEN